MNTTIRGLAPQRFADWLAGNSFKDNHFPFTYLYHPRSDGHSKALCRFIFEDIKDNSSLVRRQLEQKKIIAAINYPHTWENSRKPKTIDLAIGTSRAEGTGGVDGLIQKRGAMSRVLLSCEAKATMTEHGKSQPRLFDELESSYTIVNNGDSQAIAAGIEVINIAERFASPLRQKTGTLTWTTHRQPDVTAKMINHLRALNIRDSANEHGFDAFGCIVVDCDNTTYAKLVTTPPAPQLAERDHYDEFLHRIIESYESRFSGI